MTPITTILEAIARWLHSEGLAQYNSTGDYSDNPTRPAVVFSDVDAPDTVLLLQVENDHRVYITTSGERPTATGVDVRFTYRAAGRDSRLVDALADVVADRIMDLWSVGPLDRNGIAEPGLLDWGVQLPATAVRLLERKPIKPPEAGPPGKYQGSRFERTDVYRVGIDL